ncbi:MAG: hypothetical protein ACI8Y4_001902 [Candidatus Poriferisodalaceae bacterium]
MVSIKVAQVSRRPVWPVVAVIGLVVVLFIAFSSTNARRSGPPLDGRSTDPDGARAAALLIEQRGRSTGVAEASDLSTGVAIALTSDLDDADWAALKQFAGDGGIVIVATPVSPLWASGSSPELRPSILAGSNCGSTFGSLDDVRRLDVPLVRVFPSAPDGCLRVGDGDLVRSEPVGEGQVISLGVNSIFRNDTIGRADHALLITRLIDSTEGDVRFIEPQAFVGGSKGLLELVPRWVLAAAAQLGVALVFYVLWRAIRLGQPVLELHMTPVEASELVTATGRLLSKRQTNDWSGLRLHQSWSQELKRRTGWAGDSTQSLLELLNLDSHGADMLMASLAEPASTGTVDSAAELEQMVRRIAAARALLGWQPASEPAARPANPNL